MFDMGSGNRSIYLDGVLDATRHADGPYRRVSGVLTIGLGTVRSLNNYFNGLIDQLSFTNRPCLRLVLGYPGVGSSQNNGSVLFILDLDQTRCPTESVDHSHIICTRWDLRVYANARLDQHESTDHGFMEWHYCSSRGASHSYQ